MKLPLRVTLRHMESSPALEEVIRARADKLDETYSLIRCAVVVESPHHHARNGTLFTARVSLTVSGAEIAVTHEPHEDPYTAVRQAFEAARRRLSVRRRRRRAPVRRERLRL